MAFYVKNSQNLQSVNMDGLLLSGTNEVSVDVKGRMAVPVRCRDALVTPDGVAACVVTRSLFEPCLWLYPSMQWKEVVSALGSVPALTDTLLRTVQRVILGSAVECVLDGQGRILLPQELRVAAGFEKKAFLIGFKNKFELWPAKALEQQRLLDEKLLKEAVNSLAGHSGLDHLNL